MWYQNEIPKQRQKLARMATLHKRSRRENIKTPHETEKMSPNRTEPNPCGTETKASNDDAGSLQGWQHFTPAVQGRQFSCHTRRRRRYHQTDAVWYQNEIPSKRRQKLARMATLQKRSRREINQAPRETEEKMSPNRSETIMICQIALLVLLVCASS